MMAATIVLILAAAGLTPADSRPTALTTAVLKQRLAEAQARLWAWEIEYESAGKERPNGRTNSVHRIVAAKAPDRFFHWNSHGSPEFDWTEDVLQQRLIVTGERFISERPLDRFFIEGTLRPNDPLPGGTSDGELLLTAIGWWPLAHRPPPLLVDKLPASLARVAQSSAYQARPTLEQVGGRWCQVLECPGRDQIWLDIDRGCAVAARQITYSHPAKVHRIEFADFREMIPEVWVPFTLHNLIYERMPEGAVGQAIVDAMIYVRQVRLNEAVDDARFQFKPLPGSVAGIEYEPLRQVIPGGEEYLDEVAGWIRRYRPKADYPKSQISWVNWADMAWGALLGGAVVTVLFWCHRWIPRGRGGS